MPEQVRCPSCNASLRVPETLLGKNVKCPKCQTTFLAETEVPAESEGIVNEPAPSSRRPSAPPEEVEDEPAPDEEDERPRRRRNQRSAKAEATVAAPAICLMVLGGLDIPTALVYLVFQIINLSHAGRAYPPGQAPPGYEEGLVIGKVIVFVIIPLTILWGVLLLVGGLKMKRLQSYGMALTTSILAMLPLHCCCLLGLPFGIWALVALNNPDVKRAFS